MNYINLGEALHHMLIFCKQIKRKWL